MTTSTVEYSNRGANVLEPKTPFAKAWVVLKFGVGLFIILYIAATLFWYKMEERRTWNRALFSATEEKGMQENIWRTSCAEEIKRNPSALLTDACRLAAEYTTKSPEDIVYDKIKQNQIPLFHEETFLGKLSNAIKHVYSGWQSSWFGLNFLYVLITGFVFGSPIWVFRYGIPAVVRIFFPGEDAQLPTTIGHHHKKKE